VQRSADRPVEIRFEGDWRMHADLPAFESLLADFPTEAAPAGIAFHTGRLDAWDSGFLTFLFRLLRHCRENGIAVDGGGLPDGVQRLLALSEAVPEELDTRREGGPPGGLARLGEQTLAIAEGARDMLAFVGEVLSAALRLAAGRARFPFGDFLLLVQDCGARALPIVSLISVLVGLILAFVGAVQLRMFGAQIYVANLVGLGMAREMGAMMAAVIMAGRTGAAFAAQLGTMQANEEVDALVTLGISPIDFLVLPRIAALVLMMPLLCLYADLMGIAGGVLVGVGMLDLPLQQYLAQTRNALALNHFAVGLVKSVVFGVLVALAGCLRGMQSGRDATAVGAAATRAVVTGIVAIIVADALITVLCDTLGV
jgi:phospholipid/cholesterol/gamma-HCH transport system permease protein